jgi:hypothetical protein
VTIAGRKSNTRFGDGQPHEPLLEFRENIGSFRLTMVLQKDKDFSIANPQKVLPLPEIALESHALGYLKRRDHTTLNLLAALSGAFAS